MQITFVLLAVAAVDVVEKSELYFLSPKCNKLVILRLVGRK